MTPEGKVKAKVNRALKVFKRMWKFMPVQHSAFGMPALDYLICMNGRFVAIETKRKGGKLSPRQEATVQNLRAAGAYVFVVDDDDSLATMIAHLSLMDL